MARRPLDGSPSITQVWGEPSSAYRKGYHTGVDYGVANNTAVKSPTNGVVSVGDGRAASDGRGFYSRVQGDDGVEHLLYHEARWHVSGGRVVEGQHIADSDNTGMSTGPHLHWETRRNGVDFNPADWLYAQPAPTPPTPSKPGLQPNQRVLENKDGVYQRAAPSKNAAIIKDWPYDPEPFNFKAFVRGEDPYDNGNNIWFVGQYSGGYFWSGAFVGKNNTTGLPDQTPSPTPIPPPDPAPVEPTPSPEPEMPVDFQPDDPSVIATYKTINQGVVGADGKVSRTKDQVPKFIVIHQWDDPAKKPTRDGVIKHFQDPKVEVSAHYIVDDSGVYQMVQEKKRAWHAGPQGNDGIGIECDPNGGDAMYAHLRLLVANIRVRWNKLEIKKHSDFMATQCPNFIDVLRIEPITVPPNVPNWGEENNTLLKKILAILEGLVSKINSIFK